jgi:acyl phosphate:glycerol-3-phosphate acyltransferase
MDPLQPATLSQVSCICLGAYVLGCFTPGYYLVRARTGQDIRELGSGSVGARNVARVLGWMGFLMTVAGDFAKGAFAVWATSHFTRDDRLLTLALVSVVVGHIWPVQLRFHGGKGVAASLGGLLVFDPHLALAFAMVFVGGLALWRRTLFPALIAFASLPWVTSWLGPEPWQARSVGLSVLAGLVLLAHRKNLLEEVVHWLERRDLHTKHHESEL